MACRCEPTAYTNLSGPISAISGGAAHHPSQAGPDSFAAGFSGASAPSGAAEAGNS
jgi:hypothetical protein